jgi:hypothetical protein
MRQHKMMDLGELRIGDLDLPNKATTGVYSLLVPLHAFLILDTASTRRTYPEKGPPVPGRPCTTRLMHKHQPLMHTTWRRVCTISTRSDCAAMTASMSL